MRVERAIDSKAEKQRRPVNPAHSGVRIPLVFMPESRVLGTMMRMGMCGHVCEFKAPHS